jgi:Domain of unknown function (DUF1905)/Bacteriocin-protection, YdeI or OmpD-Associated
MHYFWSMIEFSAKILKFNTKGEKTGWSYIEISKRQAEKLNPGCLVSFRVKGHLDSYPIQKTALLPMGEGNFILPFNAAIRKATGKKAGDMINIVFELDERPLALSADLIQCLKDDPPAYAFFQTLPKSHQRYFSKWVEDAKTPYTKTKRITMAVVALSARQGFAEMMRANKGNR